jgi:hypothetical protein
VSGSVICTASSVGGLAATAPPRLLPAAGRPTAANPGRPRLPAPSGDTRATATRDATAIGPGPNTPTCQISPRRKKGSAETDTLGQALFGLQCRIAHLGDSSRVEEGGERRPLRDGHGAGETTGASATRGGAGARRGETGKALAYKSGEVGPACQRCIETTSARTLKCALLVHQSTGRAAHGFFLRTYLHSLIRRITVFLQLSR